MGIFRRSPNARVTKDLRERLDNGDHLDGGTGHKTCTDFSECSVFVTAALLKDFLRSLPDCLLMCQHYRWVTHSLPVNCSIVVKEKRLDLMKKYILQELGPVGEGLPG